MAKSLAGKKVVLTASRKVEEMSTLIEKQGGEPLVRSMQGTVYVAEESVVEELRTVIENGVDWFVLTTGIGTEKLLELADGVGLKADLLHLLENTNIAARGYKTKNALKKHGLTPTISDDDGTTNGLIRAMEAIDFNGKKVAVQLHGVPSPNLRAFFKDREAVYTEVLPYRHIAPDEADVQKLYHEIINQQVDAVCFTTILQVRALFDYASSVQSSKELATCFNEKVLAVAVGKLTAEGLTDAKISRIVVPERERMGTMIIELAKYVEAND